MTGFVFPLILIALVLLPAWPLFFRRWKHWNFLWAASTLLIISLGAWSLVYFRFERHYARLAEAEAVEVTRAALAGGITEPEELAGALKTLADGEAFQNGGVRARYRLWYDTVNEVEK